MQSQYDEPQSDIDLIEVEESESSVATLEPDSDATEPAEWTGARCEKCNAPLKSDVVAICRGCGWYASLGTFVEVDPNWETSDTSEEHVADAPKPSHLKVWFKLLPRWSWVIIGTVLAIVVESVVVRLATPSGGGLRTAWSLGQLAIGIVTVVGCHIFNFIVLA